jgi:hypothetical protein
LDHYVQETLNGKTLRARFPGDAPFGNEHPTKDVVLTEEQYNELTALLAS